MAKDIQKDGDASRLSTLFSDLFSEMTEMEVGRFADYLVRKEFPKNSTIFVEKMEGESLFMVAGGRVELTWMVAEGSEKKLVELSPGETFGELALFDPGPRAVTARVVEDADIYILTRERYHELVEKEPKLCLAFVVALFKKLAANLRGGVRAISGSVVGKR